MINWNSAAQICDEHFFSSEHSKNTLESWLDSSIESWIAGGNINSFHPFEDFFPDSEREERCLAAIGNNLRREKRQGELFSPKNIFTSALTNILAKKNFYCNNVKAWNFALRTAQEMALDETVKTLTRLIGYEEFRTAPNEKGHDLFSAAFDMVETIKPSAYALEFWQKCLAHIDKYPSLSLRLLVNLIQADSSNCQQYISESKMIKTINLYRHSLMESLDTRDLPEFDIAAQNISDVLNDDLYQKYFAVFSFLAYYLISNLRVEEIQKVEKQNIRTYITTEDTKVIKLKPNNPTPRKSVANMAPERPALFSHG